MVLSTGEALACSSGLSPAAGWDHPVPSPNSHGWALPQTNQARIFPDQAQASVFLRALQAIPREPGLSISGLVECISLL